MFSYYSDIKEQDSSLLEDNRNHKKVEPKVIKINEVMVKTPETNHMQETSKVLQLLMDQDRRLRKELLLYEELKLIETYMQNPDKQDFNEILEYEKELKFKSKFENQFIPQIPASKVNLVKSNLAIEHDKVKSQLRKQHEESKKLQKEIIKLKARKKEVDKQIGELEQFNKLGNVMDDYLSDTQNQVWSSLIEMWSFNQGHTIHPNGLRMRINMLGAALPFITSELEGYYSKYYK